MGIVWEGKEHENTFGMDWKGKQSDMEEQIAQETQEIIWKF